MKLKTAIIYALFIITLGIGVTSPGIPAPKDIGKGWLLSPGIPAPKDPPKTCDSSGGNGNGCD